MNKSTEIEAPEQPEQRSHIAQEIDAAGGPAAYLEMFRAVYGSTKPPPTPSRASRDRTYYGSLKKKDKPIQLDSSEAQLAPFVRSHRWVTISSREPTASKTRRTGPVKTFAYGYRTIAILAGVRVEAVRRAVDRGILDIMDFRSIVRYIDRRDGRRKPGAVRVERNGRWGKPGGAEKKE